MTLVKYRVINRATVYQLTVVDHDFYRYLMFADRREGNLGDWWVIHNNDGEFHWSYIAEKVPGIATYEGDKEGWIMVLKEAGIEVFG